jgi:hypothetical protein
MELARSIDQKPAWIENVIAEMRPHVCNELCEWHSPQFQRLANDPESVLGQDLPFAPGKRDQLRLRTRVRAFFFENIVLMMMIEICSSRLHFLHASLSAAATSPPPLRSGWAKPSRCFGGREPSARNL